jgi:hypothetical protein
MTMSENGDSHHLLRVRIRKPIFEKLQNIAEEKSVSLNEHVTVSDLVRSAIYNSLLIHEAARRLENVPPIFFEEDSDEEDIRIIHQPML